MLLLKLADAARILRFSEPQSGLSLENLLGPSQPVLRQKQRRSLRKCWSAKCALPVDVKSSYDWRSTLNYLSSIVLLTKEDQPAHPHLAEPQLPRVG